MTAESQTWQPEGYQRHAGFVPTLGDAVLTLLAPRPGERILDLGCGDGVLTRRLTEAGATVVGIDGSAEMVAAARGVGLDARVMDGQAIDAGALIADGRFDAVFSNAALHWMPAAEAVIAGVARVLRPGGRFVGEFGGHGNVAAIQVALHAALAARGIADGAARSPWFYPSPRRYTEMLEAAGFAVDSIDLIPRPTPLPTDMRGWLGTFAQPFVSGLSQETAGAVLDDAAARLGPVLLDEYGRWTADYVRLRFRAVLS
ncbi:MAG: methyltransferase domain-containing protein [Azospirillaceae bacterium]